MENKLRRQKRVIAILTALVIFFGGTFVGNLTGNVRGVFADSSDTVGAFAFWNTNSNGTGTTYFPGQETSLTEDKDLYAQWVLANANGGTVNSAKLVSTDASAGTVSINDDAVTAPAGKLFVGWQTSLADKLTSSGTIGTASTAAVSALKNITLSKNISATAANGTLGTYTAVYADVYPVGSIYMSVNSTNPGTLFGGTWEQIKDRFLLAAGTTYSAGSTGGEATHTLTIDEMPSHSHDLNDVATSDTGGLAGGSQYSLVSRSASNTKYWWSQTHTTGGGKAHNNMPPYLTVYVWKRTA